MGGARFRQRKLSTKQTLQILREDQVDQVDDDAQRNIPKVDTGVEKGEEIEHHLQAAISASQAAAIGGKVAQIYIPTPDTIHSSIEYDRLYPLTFSQPATYIRFSSTVEDCCGCPYNLDDEDDTFLKSMNKNASTQCSEDQFEEVMAFFEETGHAKQPFAAVDNPPVLAWEEMENAWDDTLDETARPFAKEIYQHWKGRRLRQGNKGLMPGLKLETGADTDDGDPYVCFRRREVRQVRKTRGRDAQSVEKLRKLRRELEDARHLVAMVKQRELTRREMLAVDRLLFEQRAKVKEMKRSLGIRGDDEDLINQKPQKRKPLEASSSQRSSATQLRFPSRSDVRSAEADMVTLQDVLAEKENEIQREIEQKISQHRKWNEGYIDLTRAPLSPALEQGASSSFRTAVTEYLPTPPASVSSEHSADPLPDVCPNRVKDDSVTVRYASPTYDGPFRTQPSFRRRIGRGGRLMIDRRGMHLPSKEGIDATVLDRYKYDQDDEDDEAIFLIDPHNVLSMRYRASFSGNNRDHATAQVHASRRSQTDVTINSGQSGKPRATSSQPPNLPSD